MTSYQCPNCIVQCMGSNKYSCTFSETANQLTNKYVQHRWLPAPHWRAQPPLQCPSRVKKLRLEGWTLALSNIINSSKQEWACWRCNNNVDEWPSPNINPPSMIIDHPTLTRVFLNSSICKLILDICLSSGKVQSLFLDGGLGIPNNQSLYEHLLVKKEDKKHERECH